MGDIISTVKTKCVFCGVEIEWDTELATCPECDGSGDDHIIGCVCPICGGDGFIDADGYLPCCSICFEREYYEVEGDILVG